MSLEALKYLFHPPPPETRENDFLSDPPRPPLLEVELLTIPARVFTAPTDVWFRIKVETRLSTISFGTAPPGGQIPQYRLRVPG